MLGIDELESGQDTKWRFVAISLTINLCNGSPSSYTDVAGKSSHGRLSVTTQSELTSLRPRMSVSSSGHTFELLASLRVHVTTSIFPPRLHLADSCHATWGSDTGYDSAVSWLPNLDVSHSVIKCVGIITPNFQLCCLCSCGY